MNGKSREMAGIRKMLPTPDQTQLLRACLLSGESSRLAWQLWRETVGDPLDYLHNGGGDVKRLLPLLYSALKKSHVTLDRTFQTCLRVAYLREKLRSETYRRFCRDVLYALVNESIRTIVLKGVALADTVYGEFPLRHCHDIDLLVPGDQVLRACHLLLSLGFHSRPGEVHCSSGDPVVYHQSGLPVVFHCQIGDKRAELLKFEELWSRSHVAFVAETYSRTLSAADNLLHVCINAFYRNHSRSLQWVCDAWHIVQHGRKLQWEELSKVARQEYFSAPLILALGFLKEHIGAAIPEGLVNCHLSVARYSRKTP